VTKVEKRNKSILLFYSRKDAKPQRKIILILKTLGDFAPLREAQSFSSFLSPMLFGGLVTSS
jgi:hypothetical protein